MFYQLWNIENIWKRIFLVLLVARKSAEDTLATIRLLLEHGCKDLINAADSLGNTPLHALIVRYALEEATYGYDKWNKWDVLHLVRYLLQSGASASINQTGNSALACVLRHVRDWEICYELLNMLLTHGGKIYFVKFIFGSLEEILKKFLFYRLFCVYMYMCQFVCLFVTFILHICIFWKVDRWILEIFGCHG